MKKSRVPSRRGGGAPRKKDPSMGACANEVNGVVCIAVWYMNDGYPKKQETGRKVCGSCKTAKQRIDKRQIKDRLTPLQRSIISKKEVVARRRRRKSTAKQPAAVQTTGTTESTRSTSRVDADPIDVDVDDDTLAVEASDQVHLSDSEGEPAERNAATVSFSACSPHVQFQLS